MGISFRNEIIKFSSQNDGQHFKLFFMKKPKFQKTERYLIWITDLALYWLRRCPDHGVFSILKPRPPDCPACKKEGLEIENVADLKAEYEKEFKNF